MPMPVAWALQGPPGAPRPPLPPSGSRRSDRRDLDGGRGGSESPRRCSKLRRRGGFNGAAVHWRDPASGAGPTAALPPRSESPLKHRRLVGGAPAVLRPGGQRPPGSE
ncbi:hypothetical protein NDU88_003931 [Pleurodeles waltl]|uniref:Uncharacterized protein n=1 Tax=Pleurodeles waltl TaxID=8319 RepID=A0AAV7NJL3_PLEWA|nr:hypothetical protein NDU88_003931 [Pleurodeles waltl]